MDSCTAVIVIAVLHRAPHMYLRWIARVIGVGQRCKGLQNVCKSCMQLIPRSPKTQQYQQKIWRRRPLEEKTKTAEETSNVDLTLN